MNIIKVRTNKEWKYIVFFFLLIDKQTNLPLTSTVFIHGTKHMHAQNGFIKEGIMREDYIFYNKHEDSNCVIINL